MPPALAHVDTWIFDLDNTLYPASADLFGRMDARMGQYIQRTLGVDAAEAHRIQKALFREHGTTLSGLMRTHQVDPHEFLAYVHDIELAGLAEDARLARGVARLPGRKLIFTNGDTGHAGRVLARLGLSAQFEAIHDIHAMAYRPKPDPGAYAGLCAALSVDPTRALFVDDMVRNLIPAKALGMVTVWVNNGSELGADAHAPGHVDYEIAEVGEWLDGIMEGQA